MKILRTPDECFANLKDYPFAPNYTTVQTNDGSALRIHHLDEGPRDGPILLSMHGQPVWSYLYRKMIPLLTAQGIRVIAPDLPGYGKSDKPASREDYSYQRQVDWLGQWLSINDFHGLTFFGQDWGGLIGLRMIVDHPQRFDRAVISNTGLPYAPHVAAETVQQIEEFRANAKTPTLLQMSKALKTIPGTGPSAFAYWQKFCWETETLPLWLMMSMSVENRNPALRLLDFASYALGFKSPLRSAVARAYEAPYPDSSYMMGPRAMPSQVPTLPTDPSLEAQRLAWEFFDKFDKPFLCAFGDSDPVSKGGDAAFLQRVPGAKGQPHTLVKGAGHFIQEDQPEQLCQIITEFIQANQG